MVDTAPLDLEAIKDRRLTCIADRYHDPAKLHQVIADDIPALIAQVERLRAAAHSALSTALRYGGIDGAHHKTWVIDQIVRDLTGAAYQPWVADACAGEDGPATYNWDTGIAP